MNREETIELIKNRLQMIKLLKAQPEPDLVEIDSVMWDILGDVLYLDEEHKKRINEIEAREVNTLEEEVEKRREIYELSRTHSEMILGLFNPEIEEEKQLLSLFEEMRYDAKFTEADYNLMRKQVSELKNRKEEIQELIQSAVPFEDMEKEFKESYAKFIKDNKIDSLNIDEINNAIISNAEIKKINERSRELLKTAKGIDKKEFSSLEKISDAEKRYEEALENEFLIKLRDLMSIEVNNYSELLQRTKKIEKLVLEREEAKYGSPLMNFGNTEQINENYYRSLFFMNDVRKVEHQVNLLPNIERLKNEISTISKRIEEVYGKFNSNKTIEEMIMGYKEVEPLPEKDSEYTGPVAQENQIVLANEKTNENNEILEESEKTGKRFSYKDRIKGKFYIVKAKAQGSFPVLKTIEEKTKNILDKIKNYSKRKSNYLKGKTKVILYKAKAKSKLISKISENKRKIIKNLGILAISGAIVGSTALAASNSQNKIEPVNEPGISMTIEQESNEKNDLIQLENDIDEVYEEIENYVPAIGDKIHVNDNVDLFRSSVGDNNNKKVKESDYFINRIAIVDKNSNKGKVLISSTNAGVSIDDLIRERKLKEGSFVVMAHLATGINGNFVEADSSKASQDDYGWVQVDENMLQNIKILESGLEMSEEKGISL